MGKKSRRNNKKEKEPALIRKSGQTASAHEAPANSSISSLLYETVGGSIFALSLDGNFDEIRKLESIYLLLAPRMQTLSVPQKNEIGISIPAARFNI